MWIDIQKDSKHVAKEKEKARALKKSQWWKNKIGKGICHYCKKNIPPLKLSMDHIVPISRGGRTIKSNVVPCCHACNTEKKYLTPVDMILNSMKNLCLLFICFCIPLAEVQAFNWGEICHGIETNDPKWQEKYKKDTPAHDQFCEFGCTKFSCDRECIQTACKQICDTEKIKNCLKEVPSKPEPL